MYDVAIIGGGFYGCCLALYARRHFRRVTLLEAGPALMARASLVNQARVHRGYHYPRSYLTASRSAAGFVRFINAFPETLTPGLTHLYAIAREQSRVTATQFERFCGWVGAPLTTATAAWRDLFDPRLIEAVFAVQEQVFDATRLGSIITEQLGAAGVDIRLGGRVRSIRDGRSGLELVTDDGAVAVQEAVSTTYAGTAELLEASGLPPLPLKHELAEMALIKVPSELVSACVTVMDGPFFSVLPYPSRGLHTLSHVRYTPHHQWSGTRPDLPPPPSRAALMLADAARYLPALRGGLQADSLYEVKTLLQDSEANDGRPILFRENYGLPGFAVAVGAKIDNVFDIIERLAPSWRARSGVTVPPDPAGWLLQPHR